MQTLFTDSCSGRSVISALHFLLSCGILSQSKKLHWDKFCYTYTGKYFILHYSMELNTYVKLGVQLCSWVVLTPQQLWCKVIPDSCHADCSGTVSCHCSSGCMCLPPQRCVLYPLPLLLIHKLKILIINNFLYWLGTPYDIFLMV